MCRKLCTQSQGVTTAPGLTFLHRLERVVGLDEFNRVCDLLALQDIITQTEVRHGELEHLIVPHCVLLKYRAWTRGNKQRERISGSAGEDQNL